jgi:hypothetical protein
VPTTIWRCSIFSWRVISMHPSCREEHYVRPAALHRKRPSRHRKAPAGARGTRGESHNGHLLGDAGVLRSSLPFRTGTCVGISGPGGRFSLATTETTVCCNPKGDYLLKVPNDRNWSHRLLHPRAVDLDKLQVFLGEPDRPVRDHHEDSTRCRLGLPPATARHST